MNRSLIEKLYNESADYCVRHAGDNPAWQWEEKFAELIVKECVKACSNHNDVECFGIYPVRVWMVTEACTNNIKEHFGVN
jgi:hypothetical protein